MRVAHVGITMAEFFRDVLNSDVLVFVDNVFRQAGSEVATLLGKMPSAVGYQPTLATEIGSFQERITATAAGSITSIQAVYIPADDLTDPAPVTIYAHLDAVTVLSHGIASAGLYPAVDPLKSNSSAVDTSLVSDEHYQTALAVKACLSRYQELIDLISILGMDELNPEDKQCAERALRLTQYFSQPFHVAEVFTGISGAYVQV